MAKDNSIEPIPGSVSFLDGAGELPKIQIKTANSEAELYLHGGHLTHYQRKGEQPVLFLSQLSRFEDRHAIRGGIPVIFPWFGAREGFPMHGFARLHEWELKQVFPAGSKKVGVRLCLPEVPEGGIFSSFKAELEISLDDSLTIELLVTNTSSSEELSFETCLHSYFLVKDINQVSITGLKGASYLDKTDNYQRKVESAENIKIQGEVDRLYLNTPGAVEIHDSGFGRRIRIEKSGSNSTVVWNPWIKKSEQMPDFANDEYLRMVCVESGNIGDDRITLPAGKSAKLQVVISTLPL
ncbi:MAG: Aldose 1-epimerase [Verrucomicrobiales bacterium]|nr:Aldose 1-epimerase [Verrucomicrobiales bacterium]